MQSDCRENSLVPFIEDLHYSVHFPVAHIVHQQERLFVGLLEFHSLCNVLLVTRRKLFVLSLAYLSKSIFRTQPAKFHGVQSQVLQFGFIHDQFKTSAFSLPCCPSFDLNRLRLLLRDECLDHMQSAFVLHFFLDNDEVDSSAEGFGCQSNLPESRRKVNDSFDFVLVVRFGEF